MPLREVGMFKELMPEVPGLPSLAEAKGKLPEEDRARVATYLRTGSVLAASGSSEDDWFTGEKNVARMYFRTDGVWAWMESLAYYAEKHGVAPPQEFLEHMKARDWNCPVLTHEQLVAIEQEAHRSAKKSKKLR